MKILFMGTPDFAVPTLEALIENGYEICGVVTQPDKPRGRHYTLTPPPVKQAAMAHGIPFYQPSTLRDEAFADLLAALDPEMIVVVAYGKLLPKNVLDYPHFGCVNLHGSLLPAYRGAAPMQRAIIAGEKKTGVTTMYMAEGLDTGDMLEKAEIPIGEEDDFETVHDKLAQLGAELTVSTVTKLCMGILHGTPQSEEGASYAAKIEKEDCRLDFTRSAEELHDLIRGLCPMPLAYTTLGGRILKIVSSKVLCHTKKNLGIPGSVISLDDGMIAVECGASILGITALIPEGKKQMSAAAFINGRGVAKGDILGENAG